LIVLSELIGGYDQRFTIYSLSLTALIFSIFLLIKNNYFDFKRHAIWLILLLLVSQFDAKNIFSLALDICAFWFVFTLVLRSKLKIKSHILFWPVFGLLTVLTIALSFNQKTAFLAWLISAILFIALLYFYERDSVGRKFSLLSASAITLVLSYFISLHIAGIFNLKSFHEIAYNYKSPNSVNEQMIKIAKQFSAEKEDVTVIGYVIPATYPAMLYMNKENQLPSLQMTGLFERISAKNQNLSQGEGYLFSKLKQQLKNKNNKLVFVEVKSPLRDVQCDISFLEYYFRDVEFKKDFLENYRFLNRIITVESEDKKVSFYADESEKLSDQKFRRVKHDIEVYVRR
jgi:hypothetical protein